MNRNQLYESMEHIDDRVLERSEKRKISWKRWRMGAVAAVLVAAVALGVALQPTVRVGQNSGYTTGDAAEPMAVKATALRVAQYPHMAPYPDESQYEIGGDKADAGPEASGGPGSGESGAQETCDAEAYSKAHDAWWESVQAQRRDTGYAQGLESFWERSTSVFLSGEPGENRA